MKSNRDILLSSDKERFLSDHPTRGVSDPMSPERWQQIKRIYHAAAELEGGRREG